jgi:hypothetical protein
VPEFLRRVRDTPAVTFDPGGNPRFGFDASIGVEDAETVLTDVYGMLADEAARRPAALILDEFQAITRLGASLPDLFKALADTFPGVSLVVAGSQRHLMEELVLHQHAPLFGMAQPLALGPIPDDEMVAHLRRRSNDGGKPLDDSTARYLLTRSGPIPNDIQHLAYDAFAAAGETIDRLAVDEGMRRAVEHGSALYAEDLGRCSPGQARLLSALALDPPDQPYSAAFARAVGLASASSVRKALQPLLVDEEVVDRGGRLMVNDPFFAAWLRADAI